MYISINTTFVYMYHMFLLCYCDPLMDHNVSLTVCVLYCTVHHQWVYFYYNILLCSKQPTANLSHSQHPAWAREFYVLFKINDVSELASSTHS